MDNNNWIILMVRYDRKRNKMVIPMMKSEDEMEAATFETEQEAADLCANHILAKSSECILFNVETHRIIELPN